MLHNKPVTIKERLSLLWQVYEDIMRLSQSARLRRLVGSLRNLIKARFACFSVTNKFLPCVDCEQSLFFFRFSESSARARERRSRETRETRVSRTFNHARGHLRVSRFARRTSEKRKTACSLDPVVLDPVVQKLNSAIHRINHYPADKSLGEPIALSTG